MQMDLFENNMNITLADPGEGPGESAPPSLFLDQTEAQRDEKVRVSPNPNPNPNPETVPPYLRVWMTVPPSPPLSEGLDPTLH